MMQLTQPEIGLSPSWRFPLPLRSAGLRGAKAQGRKTVAHVYGPAGENCCRYRCHHVMCALEPGDGWYVSYFFSEEMRTVEQLLENVDMLVLVRAKWTVQLQNLVYRAKAMGLPVLFDIDDAIADIDMLPVLMNALRLDTEPEGVVNIWAAVMGRMQLSASLADGFTTTNAYLGRLLSDKFAKPFAVIPNGISAEQTEVSARLHMEKQEKEQEKPFTIGYFSGSDTHVNDLQVMAPELAGFLDRYPDAHFLVVGYMQLPAELHARNLPGGQISQHPFVDYLSLQRLYAQVDVSIAPLALNEFTHCKSELKYYETAIVDTPTIASPSYTFTRCIQNGENGFLCKPGEWFAALEALYRGTVNDKHMARLARTHALAEYSPGTIQKKAEEAYTQLYYTLKK